MKELVDDRFIFCFMYLHFFFFLVMLIYLSFLMNLEKKILGTPTAFKLFFCQNKKFQREKMNPFVFV
jgi:hypothetical protein